MVRWIQSRKQIPSCFRTLFSTIFCSEFSCSTKNFCSEGSQNQETVDVMVNSLQSGSEPVVKVEKFENVLLVGVNRPEKRNAVNHQTAQALRNAFANFNTDNSSDAAILYGIGGNFCAGYDLSEVSSEGARAVLGALDNNDKGDFRPMGPTIMEFKKPVIAAVDGFAVAGGLELALMCDMRVADESAIFGVFCRRFGVPLIDGGTVRLPKLIGLSRAMDMILTGREIPAKIAFEWGLANRLVATGSALGQAVQLAQVICRFPQKCMLADRRSAYYSTFNASSFADAMDFELKNGVTVIPEESVSGAQNFVSGIGKHGSFNLLRPPGPKKSKI